MFAFLGLALLLGASSVFTRKTCSTVRNKNKLAEPQGPTVPVNITLHVLRVYWHVVSENLTPAGGNIPDKQITDSMRVLVNDYIHTGISWILAGTTRTVNADWFNNVDYANRQSIEMRRALRQGGVADLNVYTVGFTAVDQLGFSTWPSDYASRPKVDGVVINFATVPGGTYPNFNLGKILTHEVGHWCQLYHTYDFGCFGEGDLVSDTPPEASPAYGCPPGRDTCAGDDVDPIHNFMDAADDSCVNEFTPGQVTRLRQQLALFRGLAV